jgi:hypothetical protein
VRKAARRQEGVTERPSLPLFSRLFQLSTSTPRLPSTCPSPPSPTTFSIPSSTPFIQACCGKAKLISLVTFVSPPFFVSTSSPQSISGWSILLPPAGPRSCLVPFLRCSCQDISVERGDDKNQDELDPHQALSLGKMFILPRSVLGNSLFPLTSTASRASSQLLLSDPSPSSPDTSFSLALPSSSLSAAQQKE